MAVSAISAKKKEWHDCLCQHVAVIIPKENSSKIPAKHKHFIDSQNETDIWLATTCTAQTTKTYARGHDARMVGLIQTALRAEGSVMFAGAIEDPEAFAWSTLSDALAEKITTELKKPTKKAKKAEPEPPAVTAKVGRWTYEGKLIGDSFQFTNKSGDTITTEKFTVLQDA